MENLNLKKELENLIPLVLKEEFDQIFQNKDISNAQILLELCEIFYNKVNIIKKKNEKFNNYSYSATLKNLNSIEESELYTYAARLIYVIRLFLTNEEIIFHIGSSFSSNKIIDAKIPQREILPHLGVISKNAIGFTTSLKSFLNNRENIQHYSTNLLSKWKTVLDLAEVQYGELNLNSKEKLKRKGKKIIYAYAKQKADIKVYAAIDWKIKKITGKYYLLGDKFLYHFNNGWLWQWFGQVYQSGDFQWMNLVSAEINRGNLQPLFQGRDNIPGIKQGDFKNAVNQQVQSKYNNLKIISYNNILSIMDTLVPLLREYVSKSTSQIATNNLLNELKSTFIPNTANFVNQEANQILDNELLSKLNKIIKN